MEQIEQMTMFEKWVEGIDIPWYGDVYYSLSLIICIFFVAWLFRVFIGTEGIKDELKKIREQLEIKNK